MAHAKTLTDPQIESALAAIDGWSTTPLRDKVMLMLTFRAGLRSQEVALLNIEDVTDAQGRLVKTIHVTNVAAKYGRERYVPMRPDLFEAIKALVIEEGRRKGPLFVDKWGKQITPNAVQQKLARVYERAGLHGASSHSGRRTFATRAARTASLKGCSLRDVQVLLGHASIQTTECYIETSPNQRALVDAL